MSQNGPRDSFWAPCFYQLVLLCGGGVAATWASVLQEDSLTFLLALPVLLQSLCCCLAEWYCSAGSIRFETLDAVGAYGYGALLKVHILYF